MADAKISSLASHGAPVAADYVASVLASGPTSKKLLMSDLQAFVLNAFGGGSEIAVTGATTATIGRMHLCTGTSADYELALPAASGNAGKLLGVRMGTASTLTKLVTLNGNASETIDGSLTRIMWANEVAILLCDGSNWFKIAGRTIPLVCVMSRGTDQTGVLQSTVTKVTLDTIGDDSAGMANTGSARIDIKRPGAYMISGAVTWNNLSANSARTFTQIQVTGAAHLNSECSALANAYIAAFGVKPKTGLLTTDYVTLHGFHSIVANQTIYGGAGVTSLAVAEVPTW